MLDLHGLNYEPLGDPGSNEYAVAASVSIVSAIAQRKTRAFSWLVSVVSAIAQGKTVTIASTVTQQKGVPADLEWEDEAKGVAFCVALLGGNWVRTSYNGNSRKRYAGIGFTYDPIKNYFVAPQPYPSWKLDANGDWYAPKPYPTDGKNYYWDEAQGKWVEVVLP